MIIIVIIVVVIIIVDAAIPLEITFIVSSIYLVSGALPEPSNCDDHRQ